MRKQIAVWVMVFALVGVPTSGTQAADAASFAPATVPVQTVAVVVTPAATVSAAAAPSLWSLEGAVNLLQQPWALAIEASILAYILNLLFGKNAQAIKDSASRWEDLIYHCYNEAEAAGALNGWSGKAKLDHALLVFDRAFKGVFGTLPTAKDVIDATHQFATVAANRPGAADVVVTPKGVAALVSSTVSK